MELDTLMPIPGCDATFRGNSDKIFFRELQSSNLSFFLLSQSEGGLKESEVDARTYAREKS